MPAIYAHYRFGESVYRQLPEHIRKEIAPHKALFCTGLHGPDLLFYYKPLWRNRVNQLGYALHKKTGWFFFAHAGAAIPMHPETAAAHFAYLYGFLCHFALDRECHGYIARQLAESGLSHAEIETAFDRYLLVRDGKNPVRQILTNHIHPQETDAEIISHFFPSVRKQQIQKAMRSIVFYDHLLVSPNRYKRQTLLFLIRLSGKEDELQGMLMPYHANPKCNDSCQRLLLLYQSALPKAVSLICTYKSQLYQEQPWNDLYYYTFGSQYDNHAKG